jgi:hypothetical protein
MHSRIIVIIVISFFLSGCNQKGKYFDTNFKDSARKTFAKTDTVASPVQTVETDFDKNDLQLFCNNEITAYCVLLPLDEFNEDFTSNSVVKAQHKFVLKQDSTSFTSIEVQAFNIDKKNNYNTALFYNRDKRNIEEGALGIDTAYIDEAKHLYLIKGYLPNYMHMKYIQLNWIQEDRIALYLNYDEKEEALWNYRIAAIINRGPKFNNQ